MKTEQQLQAQIDALAKEIEPGRDLWPELAVRLATTPQLAPNDEVVPDAAEFQNAAERSLFWWTGGMAAAVLVSVLLWPQGADVPKLAQQAPAASAEPLPSQFTGDDNTTSRQSQAGSQVQWQLTSDFEIQRAALLAQVQQVPEFYQDWQQQLAIWQQARSQVLLALSYQPDEPVLLRQLSQLQQQQMQYLQKLVSVELTYSGVTS